jgi:hypothetical protein
VTACGAAGASAGLPLRFLSISKKQKQMEFKMNKWSSHRPDAPRSSAPAAPRPSVLTDLGDAFAALRRIVGRDGKFYVVLQVADRERFRALGPHQKELPPVGENGVTLVRSIELESSSLTAFHRLPPASNR